jgi:hypothetical protein
MSKWRERALELLPDMRADIEKAESVTMLWVELEVRYRRYYDRLSEGVGQGGAQLIRPIYAYAIWCSRAESAETSDAATIGFYYGIPVNAFNTFRSDPSKYEHILEDLVSNLGLPEIERMRWAFAALIEPPQLDKFMADCGRIARDRKWDLQKRPQGR